MTDAQQLFCTVCGAIAYVHHLFTTNNSQRHQVQLRQFAAHRDMLYDALVQQQPQGVALPPPLPAASIHWHALSPEEQAFARQAYTQLVDASDTTDSSSSALSSTAPSYLTPWWSAFFFSS